MWIANINSAIKFIILLLLLIIVILWLNYNKNHNIKIIKNFSQINVVYKAIAMIITLWIIYLKEIKNFNGFAGIIQIILNLSSLLCLIALVTAFTKSWQEPFADLQKLGNKFYVGGLSTITKNSIHLCLIINIVQSIYTLFLEFIYFSNIVNLILSIVCVFFCLIMFILERQVTISIKQNNNNKILSNKKYKRTYSTNKIINFSKYLLLIYVVLIFYKTICNI